MESVHDNGSSVADREDAERVYCLFSRTERPETIECEYHRTDSRGVVWPHFEFHVGGIYLSLGAVAALRLFEALGEALGGATL